MAIPRILHLTSARVPLTGIESAFLRRNRRLLGEGWKYRTWSDTDNDAAIAEYFPDVLDAYRKLPYGVMCADIARLAYMHIEGGWYADTDYEWLRDPTESTAAYDLVLPMSREAHDPEGERLGNAVFGSVAGHPFWALVLRDALATHIPADLPATAIEQVTGPEFFTRHLDLARTYERTWLAPRAFFHTPVPRSHGRHRPFGTHHTRGSWRTNAIRWRIRMLKQRVQRTISVGRER